MIHSRFIGWAEQVLVNKTGDPVKKGQPLLTIYSPQLVSTQEEYMLALANARVLAKSSMQEIRDDAKRLVSATRKRLAYFDIPEKVIRQLEQRATAALTGGLSQAGSMTELARQYMVATGMITPIHTLVDYYTHIKGIEYLICVAFFVAFPVFFTYVNKEKTAARIKV